MFVQHWHLQGHEMKYLCGRIHNRKKEGVKNEDYLIYEICSFFWKTGNFY